MSTSCQILERSGAVAATAVWEGDLYAGVLRIESAPGAPQRGTQVQDMINARRDLSGVLFRSIGERPTVRGWEGWEGCLGALRVALPALGLALGPVSARPDPGRPALAATAARGAAGVLD
jgi:hypothetical protein